MRTIGHYYRSSNEYKRMTGRSSDYIKNNPCIHDTGKNALTVADYCQLIAECAFENEVGNNSISEVMDWNHCVDFQRGYMLSQ